MINQCTDHTYVIPYTSLHFTDNRIFYCDAGIDTVGVINTDGSGHQVIYHNSVEMLHFFDIIRVDDKLLISNWDNENAAQPRDVQ